MLLDFDLDANSALGDYYIQILLFSEMSWEVQEVVLGVGAHHGENRESVAGRASNVLQQSFFLSFLIDKSLNFSPSFQAFLSISLFLWLFTGSISEPQSL